MLDVDDLEKYGTNFLKMFELTTEKEVAPEWFNINEPENLRVIKTNFGQVYLTFTRNTKQEDMLLKESRWESVQYEVFIRRKGIEKGYIFTLEKEKGV